MYLQLTLDYRGDRADLKAGAKTPISLIQLFTMPYEISLTGHIETDYRWTKYLLLHRPHGRSIGQLELD